MLKNRYAYPAIFSYDDDGISIEFPICPAAAPAQTKMTPIWLSETPEKRLGFICGV